MSDSSASQIFVVYAPYCTDADILTRRNASLHDHLEHLGSFVKRGIIKVGGALVEPEPTDGKTPTATGSMMIVKMASVSEVKKMLKEDVFYTSNIWDKEKLIVQAFIPGTPLP